jgi:hypothetical protein
LDLENKIHFSGLNYKLIKKYSRLSNCWAYTAAATINGAIFKKTGNKSGRFSGQQLTDCSSDASELNYYGNRGCDGGNVWNGFFFLN